MHLTDDLPAPSTAWEAAQQLAAEGKHVHHVSEGESVCVSDHCKPGPVR
jgi:hypothetical protein